MLDAWKQARAHDSQIVEAAFGLIHLEIVGGRHLDVRAKRLSRWSWRSRRKGGSARVVARAVAPEVGCPVRSSGEIRASTIGVRAGRPVVTSRL